ncbi:MAG: hypothetical protein ACRDXX_13125 [Stackebrandtia sp.]
MTSVCAAPGVPDEPTTPGVSDPAAAYPRCGAHLALDARRDAAHLTRLEAGRHPLSWMSGTLRLHDEAAPVSDKTAPGRRCGDCVHRQLIHDGTGRAYPKCRLRPAHGPSSDVAAWWPACTDHSRAGDEEGAGDGR